LKTFFNSTEVKRNEERAISGRSIKLRCSPEEKFKFDIQYVDNISLILDIKILFLTIINVISRKNINNIDNLPMKEFKGTIE
jgi:lipopolysaccharide/colanic/teichoic acid biosynthesis glycosyltransferase